MDPREDRVNLAQVGLSDFAPLTQLAPSEGSSSLDIDRIIPNGHSSDNPTSSTAILTIPIAAESILTEEAKQKRCKIFNSEFLCTSADAASKSTSFSSLPHLFMPVTEEYANMILGRQFKVSRCRTLQALKLSARVKCTRYNAAAIMDETLVQDIKKLDIGSLAATSEEHRESQRQQLLDLLGYVEPADPSADQVTRRRAPAIDPPLGVFIGINVRIGREFYANAGVRIHDHAPVIIGNHVRLGPNVSLLTEYHPNDAAERRRGDVLAKSIEIGDDVWIGAGATVLGGVKIGNRAIVGAGALVNRDVGEGQLVVGVPARAVRVETGSADEVNGKGPSEVV